MNARNLAGLVNLDKLAEAREAVDAAQEAATLAAEKIAVALAIAAAAPVDNRIGITVRFPEPIHEQLRVLASERRTSKQALIEGWVAEQLTRTIW